MSKARNISNLFSANTDLSTDAEVTAALSTHSSSADPHSVYLKESEYVAAGKNFIANGAFDVWQRGISFSSAGMTADRWYQFGNDTLTRQSFTATSPEIPNGLYYLRLQGTGTGTYHYIETRIENGHNDLSGKTVTISFWGRSNTGSNNSFSILTALNNDSQLLSSGFTLTPTWTRYSATFNLPTINYAATYRYLRMGGIGDGGGVDIAQVQYEIGSIPTHFSRAGGSIQGEVAECQRYYIRYNGGTSGGVNSQFQAAATASNIYDFNIQFPVKMRTVPSSIEVANTGVYRMSNGTIYTGGSWTLSAGGDSQNAAARYTHTSSIFTAGADSAILVTAGIGPLSYIAFSAELF